MKSTTKVVVLINEVAVTYFTNQSSRLNQLFFSVNSKLKLILFFCRKREQISRAFIIFKIKIASKLYIIRNSLAFDVEMNSSTG